MNTISILNKIKECLRKSKQENNLFFPPFKFTSDFNYFYKNQFKFKQKYYLKASVFVLIKELENNLYVVLTKRSKNLSSHPGQISFPGGRVDKNDNSILHAGLREVEEEIGVKQESIETFGVLPPHETISRYIIYPFVGFIKNPIEFKINNHEVEELFLVPLDFFLVSKNMQYHKNFKKDKYTAYYAIPYGPYYIWGATARIIKSFIARYQS